MNFRPYTVARFGVYAALFVAGMSVWLGVQAGASLDYTLLRGVFVFVIFTAIGFGAEAVLTIGVQPVAYAVAPQPEPETPEPGEDQD